MIKFRELDKKLFELYLTNKVITHEFTDWDCDTIAYPNGIEFDDYGYVAEIYDDGSGERIEIVPNYSSKLNSVFNLILNNKISMELQTLSANRIVLRLPHLENNEVSHFCREVSIDLTESFSFVESLVMGLLQLKSVSSDEINALMKLDYIKKLEEYQRWANKYEDKIKRRDSGELSRMETLISDMNDRLENSLDGINKRIQKLNKFAQSKGII